MSKITTKFIPDSFKNRFLVLFVIFAVLAGFTNSFVQYTNDKKSFHKYASETVLSIHQSIENKLKEAILYDDIFTLFTMVEKVANSVSLIKNVYILDNEKKYVTDAFVSKKIPEGLIDSSEFFDLKLKNGKVIGHAAYIIDAQSINSTVLRHSFTSLMFVIPIIVFFTFLSIKMIVFFTKPLDIISKKIRKTEIEELPVVFELPDYSSVETKKLAAVITKLSEELERHINQNIEHEKLLAKEERLAAIGSMSAGLAHELRNPAMSLQMLIHSIKDADNSIEQEDIEVMQREVTRIGSTVNEFLNISKPIDTHPKKSHTADIKLSLNEHIERIMHGGLKINFEGKDFEFISDPIMIFNILEDLLKNSYEAGATLCQIEFLEDNSNIIIEYSDNGSGISEDNRDKIFRPFFTTKKSGTGLGMSMCEKMASALGGSIILDTKHDKGAKFIVKVKNQI